MVLYFWEKQSLLATNSTNTTAAFSFNNINNLLTSIISLVLSVVYQQSLVSLVVMCLMYVFCLYFACLMVFLWQLFLFSLNRLALELTKCHLGDQEHFTPQWRNCPAMGRESGWTSLTSREEGPRNHNIHQGCVVTISSICSSHPVVSMKQKAYHERVHQK